MKLIPKLLTGWQPINQLAVKEWSDNWKSRTTKSRILLGRGVETDKQYTERRKRETAPLRTWRSDAADIAHGIGEGVLALHPYTAIPYFGAKVGQDFLNGNVSWLTAVNATVPIFHFTPTSSANTVINTGYGYKKVQLKPSTILFPLLSNGMSVSYAFNKLPKSIGEIIQQQMKPKSMLTEELNAKISLYANLQKNGVRQIFDRMSNSIYADKIKSNSNLKLSANEPILYFENIDPTILSSYRNAIIKTNKWWDNFALKHNAPTSSVLVYKDMIEEAIKNISGNSFAVSPSPYVYMPTKELLFKNTNVFKLLSKATDALKDFWYNIIRGHETAHTLSTPKEHSPLSLFIKDPNSYFKKKWSSELAARGSQIKNYYDKGKISGEELQYAAENYVKDTGVDNDMTAFFEYIKKVASVDPKIWNKMAKWISEVSPIGLLTLLPNQK